MKYAWIREQRGSSHRGFRCPPGLPDNSLTRKRRTPSPAEKSPYRRRPPTRKGVRETRRPLITRAFLRWRVRLVF